MKFLIIGAIVFTVNTLIVVGIINHTLDRIIEVNRVSREQSQKEMLGKLLLHSAVADFIIPEGEYKGESAEGVCLDGEGSKLLLEAI